MTVLLKE